MGFWDEYKESLKDDLKGKLNLENKSLSSDEILAKAKFQVGDQVVFKKSHKMATSGSKSVISGSKGIITEIKVSLNKKLIYHIRIEGKGFFTKMKTIKLDSLDADKKIVKINF